MVSAASLCAACHSSTHTGTTTLGRTQVVPQFDSITVDKYGDAEFWYADRRGRMHVAVGKMFADGTCEIDIIHSCGDWCRG